MDAFRHALGRHGDVGQARARRVPAAARGVGVGVAIAMLIPAALVVARFGYRPGPNAVHSRPASPSPGAALAQVVLQVDGMTCPTCSYRVSKALVGLPGVNNAEVSLERGRAVVTYEERKVTVEQMIKAIERAGYAASPIRAGRAGETAVLGLPTLADLADGPRGRSSPEGYATLRLDFVAAKCYTL